MQLMIKESLFSLVCLSLSCSVFAAAPLKKHNLSYSYNNHHPYRTYAPDYKNEMPLILTNPNHWEIIGAGGIANVDAGHSYLGVTSSETDELVQTNEDDWKTAVEQAGIGFVYYFPNKQRFSCCTQWFPSIEPELNYYHSSFHINGDVYRFSDPAFNEFSYKSTIETSRLMLDAALTVVSKGEYSLFVIGGIGEARHKVSYHDSGSVNDPCNLAALRLSDRNQSNYVWEAGAGVAYAFNNRFNLSLEYLYTNFGKLKLTSSAHSTTLTIPQITPSPFTLHSQAVLLGLHVGLS